MRTIRTAFAVVACICLAAAVAGCGAGYRTTTKNGHESVYRVDEDGGKTLVYEVDKEGTLTVHDESDPRAQQMLEMQQRLENAEIAEQQRIEAIKAAPKRSSGDPIFVVVHPVDVDPRLAEAQHSEGAIDKQVHEDFQGDALIQLVDGPRTSELAQFTKALSGKAPGSAPGSDVEVVTRAYLEEQAGINRKTGKLGTMVVLVLEGTITCNYIPAEYTVTEKGNIFRNADVTKNYAEQVKAVIINQIGPTIPADRNL